MREPTAFNMIVFVVVFALVAIGLTAVLGAMLGVNS